MSTIVLRSVKGTPLTNTEVDANFSNLNTDKIQIGGTYSSGTANGVLYLNGSKVAATGSGLTFDGTTLSVSALNATTIDLTNLEITNLKAKDGTASITIADSTGAVSFANNVTLGDATTDTVRVNGYMGVGGAGSSTIGLYVRSTALTGTTQYGFSSTVTASSSATTALWAIEGAPNTPAESFSVSNVAALRASNASKGAGSTITNQHGLYIADQTNGTNNYGITSLVSSGSNKWNIYASGTAQNYFAGDVQLGNGATLKIDDQDSITFGTFSAGTSGVLLQGGTSTSFLVYQAGKERMALGTTEAVFNDASNDVDFRVESDTNTHALFVDAGNSRVGINNSSPAVALDVTGDILASASVVSTSNLYVGGNATTTTPALNRAVYLQDTTNNGTIGYSMYINDGANNRRGSMFLNDSTGVFGFDITASSGVPSYKFYRVATEYFGIGDEVVVNESSADIDFRVESDGSTHMLFVDAGNNRVGIGDNTPQRTFSVQGGTDLLLAGNNTSGGTLRLASNMTDSSVQYGIITQRQYALTAEPEGYTLIGGTSTSTLNYINIGGGIDEQNMATQVRIFVGPNVSTRSSGVAYMAQYMDASQIVFNEGGYDQDFRVESDTSTHALFVDAGNSRIGINQSNPTAALDMVGLGFYQYSPGAQYPVKRSVTESNQGSNASATYSLVARVDFGVSWSAGNFPVITVSRVYRDGMTNYTKYALRNESTLEIIESYNGEDVLRIKGPVTYNSNTGVYEIWIAQSAYAAYQIVFEGAWSADSIPSTPSGQSVQVLTVTEVAASATTSAPAGLTQATSFFQNTVPNSESVFNEYGADLDFRVESDTNTHALFVDAGNSRVGVNTSTPRDTFDVDLGTNSSFLVLQANRANAGTTSSLNAQLFTITVPYSNGGAGVGGTLRVFVNASAESGLNACANRSAVFDIVISRTGANSGGGNTDVDVQIAELTNATSSIGAPTISDIGLTASNPAASAASQTVDINITGTSSASFIWRVYATIQYMGWESITFSNLT